MATDLSKLSDDELSKIAGGAPAASPSMRPAPPKDVSALSTEALQKIAFGTAPKEEELGEDKSVGRQALDGVVEVGKAIDSYTGAPTRSAIGAVQDGGGFMDAVGTFADRFGSDPALAPTGKEIALKAGIPDVSLNAGTKGTYTSHKEGITIPISEDDAPTLAGVAGFGVDVLADPTNVIPVGAAVKFAGKGTTKAANAVGKGLARGTIKAVDAIGDAKAATKAIDVVSDSAKSATQALGKIFSPKRADDFDDFARIAKNNGIDPAILPEAVEFGPDSFISRASRAKAEGVLGQKKLEVFREAHGQVQGALNNKIAKIAKGSPLAAADAGNVIRQGYDDGVENFFQNIDITHDKIAKTQPGLMVNRADRADLDSAINGLEKFAKGRMMRGITKTQQEQGRQLMQAVQAYRRGNGSYKQTTQVLRDIGEVAFKTKGSAADIPVDVEKFRDMYFKINDALINTVRKDVNPEFAVELVTNNKAMTEFIGSNKAVKEVIKNAQVAPENVFKSLVLNGDSQKIEALKGVLSPDQLQQVKGAVLENLIKRDPDGAFNFKTLFSAMRNKRGVLEALFEPSELVEIGEIVKLGDRLGNPIMSTSGTGASNVFKDIAGSIRDGVLNDAVIESMKDRARRPGLSIPTAAKAPAAAPKVLGPSPARSGLTVPRRSKLEKLFKGAQSTSVQSHPSRGVASDDE